MRIVRSCDVVRRLVAVTSLSEGEQGLWSCLVPITDESTKAVAQDRVRVERRDLLDTKSDRSPARAALDFGDRGPLRGT
jgi:hypothetical protein